MDLEKLIDMFERVQEEFYWTKVSVYLNKYEECLDFLDENNNNLTSLTLKEITKIKK